MTVFPPRPFIETLVRQVVSQALAAASPAGAATAAAAVAPPRATRSAPRTGTPGPHQVFNSPEALAAKREIVRAARKLWLREYVDGNRGNISCRLADDYVLCTPTLLSKADVRQADIVMVDLDGNQVAGARRRSSEISLHVAIMREVPEARAVIHCHPPHATAYAMTGRVPPEWLLAEPEVFIGPVARVPYETPGSAACANAVAEQATRHNTLLLVNHGVACWADTVTHAEWHVEIVDTYCRTLILAAQLGAPLVGIPADKVRDLLNLKKTLGLPDARYQLSDAELAERAARQGDGIAETRADRRTRPVTLSPEDQEHLVRTITDQVSAALGQGPTR